MSQPDLDVAATATCLGAKYCSCCEAFLLVKVIRLATGCERPKLVFASSYLLGILGINRPSTCAHPPPSGWYCTVSPTLHLRRSWMFLIRAARGTSAWPAGTHLTKHGSLITAIVTGAGAALFRISQSHQLPVQQQRERAHIRGKGWLYLAGRVLGAPVHLQDAKKWCLSRQARVFEMLLLSVD